MWSGLGLIASGNGLLIVDSFPEEFIPRLEPTLLDLGIALAAGAIATYAKVNPGAVSSWPVQPLRWPSYRKFASWTSYSPLVNWTKPREQDYYFLQTYW